MKYSLFVRGEMIDGESGASSLQINTSKEKAAMTTRLARFWALLDAAGLDGAVISRPENLYYLTGVDTAAGRPVFAVVGPQRTVVVVPGRAASPVPDIELVGYGVPGMVIDRVADVDRESAAALRQAIDQAGLRDARIGIEDSAISFLHTNDLTRLATLVPLRGEVEALRRPKDADERRLIQEAIRCNEAGFDAARLAIKPGVSEFEVFLAVAEGIQRAAGVGIDLTSGTNGFASGSKTATGGGIADQRQLAHGDLMIIDVNPVIHCYKGDLTRTFCVGEPANEQKAMHDTLVRAHDIAMKVGRPGVAGQEVDAALRQTLVDAGYGKWLKGHMGHGIGLIHIERPYIIPGEPMRLEENMVLALEPGVYVTGEFGMRLEDNYVVTASGLEPLSHYPREIVACG